MRSLHLLGTWCFVKVSWTSLCGMEPNAFARSSHNTGQVALPLSGLLNELCHHTGMLQTSWHSWNVAFLDRCIDVGVLCQVGTQLFGNSAEENLCLGIHTPSATLHCAGIPPFSRRPKQEFGTVLIHFVWSATRSWSREKCKIKCLMTDVHSQYCLLSLEPSFSSVAWITDLEITSGGRGERALFCFWQRSETAVFVILAY